MLDLLKQIDNPHCGKRDGGRENRIDKTDLLVRNHAVRNNNDGAKNGQERASSRTVKEKQDCRPEQDQENQRIPVPGLDDC